MTSWTTGGYFGSFSGGATNATYINVNFGRPAPPPMNQDPMLQGNGPVECSSETALARRPLFIHDVNGYYRSLGVDPQKRPSRKDLRLAYFEVNGDQSDFVTYALQQLLDPVTRDLYDNMPFGVVFLDKYEQDKLMKRAKAEASRRMQERGQDPFDADAEKEHVESIFQDMGMHAEFEEDSPEDALAEEPEQVQDEPAPPAKFEFAYYLWRTSVRYQEELLALLAWQSYLIRAFSRRGIRQRFSVGFHGQENRYMLAKVGYREVFFLGRHQDPDADLAEAAVSAWLDS